jgi:bacterioferritin
MHHAETLIARIIFLEGTPTVSHLNQIHVGAEVLKQLQSDKDAEVHTNGMYNEAIRLADDAKDAATRELLESIVKEEDGHVDWLEEQLDQIAQMGIPLYLSTQTQA